MRKVSKKALHRLRRNVEAIDHKILKLLSERFKLTTQIQQFKKAHRISIVDKKREQSLLSKYLLSSRMKKLPPACIKKIYRLIFSYSKKPGIMNG